MKNIFLHGKAENPIAFEVPIEPEGSLIKKHPPRRIRQLVESSNDEPGITHEALEEKVHLANERRNKVNSRVFVCKE